MIIAVLAMLTGLEKIVMFKSVHATQILANLEQLVQ